MDVAILGCCLGGVQTLPWTSKCYVFLSGEGQGLSLRHVSDIVFCIIPCLVLLHIERVMGSFSPSWTYCMYRMRRAS